MTAHTPALSRTPLMPNRVSGRAFLLLSAAIFAVYLAFLHPWLMAWGATLEEQRMALPGVNLIPPAAPRITRAITIHAPPEQVWLWLLQIGQDRAGFYSYDWLENLTTADIHNADAIRPDWQQRAVGDRAPMARADILGGRLGAAIYLPIKLIEPGRAIGNVPCMFVLQPVDAHTTRLLCREAVAPTRASRPPGWERRCSSGWSGTRCILRWKDGCCSASRPAPRATRGRRPCWMLPRRSAGWWRA
jgi:hypothetical protein